jgi:hypothetical protein
MKAAKPIIHGPDHLLNHADPIVGLVTSTDASVTIDTTGSSYDLSVSGGGGGDGYQFNSGTYGATNTGDYSIIEYSGEAPSGSGWGLDLYTTDNVNGGIQIRDIGGGSNGIIIGTDGEGGNGIAINTVITNQFATSSGPFSLTTPYEGGYSLARVDTAGHVQEQIEATTSTSNFATDTLLLQAAGQTTGNIELGLLETGLVAVFLNDVGTTGSKLVVYDKGIHHSGAPIFEVRDDGTVHIRTGGSIVADL